MAGARGYWTMAAFSIDVLKLSAIIRELGLVMTNFT